MIDWTEIRDGYNNRYGTQHSIKSMLQSVYEKEGSMLRMEHVLGPTQEAIRRAMILCKITIQLPGHRRPTKLDKFKEISDNGLTDEQIASRIGSTIPCVRQYQHLKKKGYEYGNKIRRN